MNSVKKTWAIMALSAVLIAPELYAETAVGTQIDTLVKNAMLKDNIPGLALAIIKKGQPLLIKGYGEANLPATDVDSNTLFAIGSVSKVYTAFAVMTLVQQGKINLDDSVLKYIPSAPAQWKTVTIRQLLSHTSGIPQHQGPHLPWQKTWQQLAQEPMQFTPGTSFKYNNFGFIVLGRVVEVASGEKLSNYLQETVFSPLAMSSTGFPKNLTPTGMAMGYHFINGQYIALPNKKPWIQMWGSGGIVSTINDMAKWDMAMTAGDILNPQTYAMMWSPVFLANGNPSGRNGLSWALGWQVSYINNKLVAQKDGAIRGYSSFIIRHIDDQISIILLTNTNHTHLQKLARKIFLTVQGKNSYNGDN